MSNILKTHQMKTLIASSSLVVVLLSSCATQKVASYNDDVYANPKQDKIEEARLAAIAKQEKEAREKRYNDSVAAVQKAKDDANPYYKDREFKYDDYYDYEYATRIKRFNNNINGLGYYDNYYTNSYWYSGNPYNYGVSVYNGYSWWGPSYNAYSYYPSVTFYSNWGWGCSPYYGYGSYYGYNPYMSSYWHGYYNGYNQGYYNGAWGYPYYGYGYGGYGSPYGYGGWGNPYYNGWGYYNAYDYNSSYTYGPRTSHGGGNSRRVSNPGLSSNDDGIVKKYIQDVNDKQAAVVKFADANPINNNSTPVKIDKYGNSNVSTKTETMNHNPNWGNEPVRNTNVDTKTEGGIKTTPNFDNGGTNHPVKTNPVYDTKPNTPIKQNNTYGNENIKPNKVYEKSTPINTTPSYETPKQNNNFQMPNFNSGGGNNGGGGRSSGGGSNGGGSHRPR